jgi:rare lipoprotein A (peptidoglycan hydrolase)
MNHDAKLASCTRYIGLAVCGLLLATGETARTRSIQPVPKPRTCIMISSYYGPRFHGRLTASGARFDKTALTVAHRTLPFGTRLRLTYPKTNRSVIVEVNDRGPYSKFNGVRYYEGNRDLDVSEGVAQWLGFEQEGLAVLLVEFFSDGSPARKSVSNPKARSYLAQDATAMSQGFDDDRRPRGQGPDISNDSIPTGTQGD